VGRTGKVRAVLAALLVLAATAACSDESGGTDAQQPKKQHRQPSIEVDRPDALADQAVHIRVGGLVAHEEVTLGLSANDQRGQPWGARGQFTADAHGGVDLDATAPRGGRPYAKAAGMGLFNAMLPRGGPSAKAIGSGNAFSYHPPSPAKQPGYALKLTLSHAGKPLATRTLTRRWLRPGSEHRRLTVARDHADGELYAPPKGSPRKAPVLVFGGSEGGNAGEYAAALLASHGHPALSLCYFRCGSGSGRPNGIDMIDLRYFTHAAHILARQPAADPRRMAVLGNSRGSEAAQLLGQRYPGTFRNVIAYAPSSKVIGPYPAGRAAWADGGKPIPTGPIPLNHVRGSVLAIAGTNDKMWGSAASARAIAAQRNASGARHREITFAGAGHHVNWFPYGQPGQDGGADGNVDSTSRADQLARMKGWPRVLSLLRR
jgi:dienelactone hydrolase